MRELLPGRGQDFEGHRKRNKETKHKQKRKKNLKCGTKK